VEVIKIFEDMISGKVFKRAGLDELIKYACPNDLLCVVRIDRLAEVKILNISRIAIERTLWFLSGCSFLNKCYISPKKHSGS